MVRISLMTVTFGASLLGACQTQPLPDTAPELATVDAPAPDAPWREVMAENLVILKTTTGDVII